MSNLKNTEKSYLKKILESDKGAGFVFDYSDDSLEKFFADYNIDIHSEKYQTYGTSKGKKMQAFWDQESNSLVSKVLSEMLDSYEVNRDINNQEIDAKLLGKAREIVARLLEESEINSAINIESDISLSHEYITEQIQKSTEKIKKKDYDGAITNARSLVESFQEELIRKAGAEVPNYAGDIGKLYKTTKKVMNFDSSQKDLSDTLKQVLSGLNSIMMGIAGLSNKMGDRHARTYKPERHHAKLAVNSALMFCEFLLDSYEYQQDKKTP